MEFELLNMSDLVYWFASTFMPVFALLIAGSVGIRVVKSGLVWMRTL